MPIYVILCVALFLCFSEPTTCKRVCATTLLSLVPAQIAAIKGNRFCYRTCSECEFFTFGKCVFAGIFQICCHQAFSPLCTFHYILLQNFFWIFMLLAALTFLWGLWIIVVRFSENRIYICFVVIFLTDFVQFSRRRKGKIWTFVPIKFQTRKLPIIYFAIKTIPLLILYKIAVVVVTTTIV